MSRDVNKRDIIDMLYNKIKETKFTHEPKTIILSVDECLDIMVYHARLHMNDKVGD